MRNKVAKALRKKAFNNMKGDPYAAGKEYKRLKKAYKKQKGQI